jgi:hypothetical protein
MPDTKAPLSLATIGRRRQTESGRHFVYQSIGPDHRNAGPELVSALGAYYREVR